MAETAVFAGETGLEVVPVPRAGSGIDGASPVSPELSLSRSVASPPRAVHRDKMWEKYLPQPYIPMTQYLGPVNHQWQDRWNVNLGLMRAENLFM